MAWLELGACAFLAGDQLENSTLGDLLALEAPDIDAVAEHRRPVCDADQLGCPMGDDQDAGAARLQLPHFLEEPLGRFEIEGGGAFVEDENLRIGQQRAPDGDPLLETEW